MLERSRAEPGETPSDDQVSIDHIARIMLTISPNVWCFKTMQSQFDKSKRKERAREREIREKERERELAKEKEREGGRDERETDNLIQGIKLTNNLGNRSREEK
ncbi:hypothetical protein Tco_0158028 [Tanacetum coccineum]